MEQQLEFLLERGFPESWAHLSAHCLRRAGNKEENNRKKCKMHLKILFHFPFCQKQKYLNNRGQKQLLQNFQELGRIKSPVRRTVFRRLPPLSCQTWACRLGNPAEMHPGAASPSLKQTSALQLQYFKSRRFVWICVPIHFKIKLSERYEAIFFPHPYFSSANCLARRLSRI